MQVALRSSMQPWPKKVSAHVRLSAAFAVGQASAYLHLCAGWIGLAICAWLKLTIPSVLYRPAQAGQEECEETKAAALSLSSHRDIYEEGVPPSVLGLTYMVSLHKSRSHGRPPSVFFIVPRSRLQLPLDV